MVVTTYGMSVNGLDMQCYQSYTTLTDAYRATSTRNTDHGDCASARRHGRGGWPLVPLLWREWGRAAAATG
eukprot:SAG25_NODE_5690_length_630_cov_1.020716_1_plen_70_part_10